MPHHPFTRTLAILVVLLVAVLLLWPGEVGTRYGFLILGPLPLIMAAFTWSAVRGASPFNEYGFHRTLPGGDREAFRRVLGIHGVVFGGILLVLLVHAAISNVRWAELLYAIAVIFLPLTAFCGLVGTLATISATGRLWRVPAWLAVSFAYAGSWYLVMRLGGGQMGLSHHYYLSGLRCMLLAGALLYPVCWWAVAVRRRKHEGFSAAVILAVLLPWIAYCLNFFHVSEGSYKPPVSSLSATRKPLPGMPEDWPKVDDMLELSGLQEGEFGRIVSLSSRANRYLRGDSPRRAEFGELSPGAKLQGWTWPQGGNWAQSQAWFGKSGGRIVWGEAGIFQHLRGQLPAHETFGHFDQRGDNPVSRPPTWPDTKLLCFVWDEKPEVLSNGPWQLELDGPLRWEAVGHCKAASGGRFRLSIGGVLTMQPLLVDYGEVTLRFRYRGGLFEPGFQWFGEPDEFADPGNLRLLLIDESGKRAFALGDTIPSGIRYGMLGATEEQVWSLWPEDPERVELLRGGTLYIFRAVWTKAAARDLQLPPP